MGVKYPFKRQLHSTYVVAVGWEPHGSSPTACTGKVDQPLQRSVCQCWPNKAETAVHGCYCPDDMTVRMRKVLARS